jgi:hypothetical protein
LNLNNISVRSFVLTGGRTLGLALLARQQGFFEQVLASLDTNLLVVNFNDVDE